MPVTIDQTSVIDNTFDYVVTITETNVDVVAISQTSEIDNTFDYTYDIVITNIAVVAISKTAVIDNTFDYTYRMMGNRTSFNARQTMNVQPGVGFMTLTYPKKVYKCKGIRWHFKMVQIVDYATPLITDPANITVMISVNGLAFQNIYTDETETVLATVYSIGNGWYYIDVIRNYMAGDAVVFKASATGQYTSDEVIYLYYFYYAKIAGMATITNDFDYGYEITVA